jgi:hypothetical protein
VTCGEGKGGMEEGTVEVMRKNGKSAEEELRGRRFLRDPPFIAVYTLITVCRYLDKPILHTCND